MTLQSSGAISLLDLQNEYGGSSPISLSEYYRNGAYVPNSITATVREPTSGDYYTASSYEWTTYSDGTVLVVLWAGADAGVPNGYAGSSYTVGSYTYYKGAYRSTDSSFGFIFNGVYRTSGSSILVNQNVPTSGTISLSNFYGGRKT